MKHSFIENDLVVALPHSNLEVNAESTFRAFCVLASRFLSRDRQTHTLCRSFWDRTRLPVRVKAQSKRRHRRAGGSYVFSKRVIHFIGVRKFKVKKLFILLGLALVVGCGESQPTNVADGASLSEIEQYRQMVEESEKAAAAGYEEAEAAYSADPKS